MIDYISTEIVAYADDFPLSFHDAYPIVQLDKLLITYTDGTGTHTYGYDMAGTTSVLPAGGTVANAIPQCVGNAIFAFILKSYDNQVFKQSEVLDSIGVCYYVITDSTNELGFPIYYKLTPSDIPSDIKNPFTGGIYIDLSGDDIYWLYNFGSSLVSSSSFIGSLLNFNIGGYNLLGLLFGSGFIVYIGWVVVKWIIPL